MNIRAVSITRQTGTGGEEIAQGLATKLGFRYYDHQVVQAAAEEAGVSPEAVSEAEQTPPLMTRILEALARTPSMPASGWSDPLPVSASPLLTSNEYRQFIEGVVRDLADQGDCVIVGHSGSIILRGRPDALRVLITGSPKIRAQRIMEAMGVDEKKALKTIKESDADRTGYFRRFYDVEWLHPANYDICISTDHITYEQGASLLAYVAQQR